MTTQTIYKAIMVRLFFAIGFPFVLTEGIIKNPRQPFFLLRQLWCLLTFLALLGQSNKPTTDTADKKEGVCC